MRGNWKSPSICLVLLLALCGLTACQRERGVEAASGDQLPSVSPAEQDFMMKATQAHLAELDMARIALQKSENGEVKDYANMMERDHYGALEDLRALMRNKNVSAPPTVAPETMGDISRMAGLTGSELDREFANMMVTEHQNVISMFRDLQAIAQNPDVKDYVDDLIPKMEMHLDKARRLQSKLFSGPNKQQNDPGDTR